MINYYCNKIIKGKMLWKDVPSYWNEDVQDELVKRGYVLNEDGTVSLIPQEKVD